MERLKVVLLSLALTTVSVGIFSCEKDEGIPLAKDAEGLITSMPYQWKTSLSTDGGLIYGLIRESVSFDNNVLLSSQDGESIKMAMLSSRSGKILWEWDDLFEEDRNFDVSRRYQYNQYFAFQRGNRAYTIEGISKNPS